MRIWHHKSILKRVTMLSGPPTISDHDRRKNHQSLQVSICPVTADQIGQTNPGEIASIECSVCATETRAQISEPGEYWYACSQHPVISLGVVHQRRRIGRKVFVSSAPSGLRLMWATSVCCSPPTKGWPSKINMDGCLRRGGPSHAVEFEFAGYA